MDMREHIKEQSELALSYVDVCAYHSAARTLVELAGRIEDHAAFLDRKARDASLRALASKLKKG